ncbi:putative methyltransferase tdiE [Colletotrichum trifolii]|uniref:Putative methyltransferase tdiE n=1 Tax=Colletotrichum trifolii TaxID=5466 RepID=A0A4R8R5Y5_COLTR|nr:putative methyltransferase tdiE [Colletotrichum trifolii]
MFLLAFDGRLGTAPPNEPGSKVGRVLDVGTGTGVWALDFGEDHPDSEIIGVDLSANQPGLTLPNVVFEVDDVEEDWMWSRPFDYIHSRMMNSSISNWKSYIQKCFDNLSPGGYLELNEISLMPRSDDGTLKEDCGLLKFSRMWGEAAAMFGRPFLNDLTVLKDYLLEVGFEDVHAQMFKWPSNPWAKEPKYKEIGLWNLENSVANLEGFMMAPLTRAHEWSREEVTVFAMQVRKEMTDRSIHSYSVIWSIYGRKPAAKAQAQAGA